MELKLLTICKHAIFTISLTVTREFLNLIPSSYASRHFPRAAERNASLKIEKPKNTSPLFLHEERLYEIWLRSGNFYFRGPFEDARGLVLIINREC